MNKIVVGLLLVVGVSGCKKTEAKGEPVAATPEPAAASSAPPPPPPPTPSEEIQGKATLDDALAYAKPRMADTVDKTDEGTTALASWMARHPDWASLTALPETSVAKVLKDSDEERGKRICTGGRIVQITVRKVEGPKTYSGVIQTSDLKYLAYYAVGSTGNLVERSPAKFCGVVTGKYSYSNTLGGTTHSVRAVGMFDLPENNKKKP